MFSELINDVTTFLSQNQFLAGGIGTVMFGSFAYLLKGVPRAIYKFFKRSFTCEFTVTTAHDSFDDTLILLNKHRVNFLSRTFSIAKKDSSLIPGYGTSFAFFSGRFIIYHKFMLENKNKIEEQVTITIFTRKKSIIEKMIKETKRKADDDIRVYFSRDDWWEQGPKKKKRSLDTVFLDKKVKDRIINRIQWFSENEDWYRLRGIPYKQCWLLHGPPGTGKTSIVHAIASHCNKNVRYISDLIEVDNLLSCVDPVNDVIVIEDIDALSNLKRDDKPEFGKKKPSSEQILHKLLNTLDGFKTPHGIIVLMTTNHPQKLDAALLRKGRVDESLEIGPIEKDVMAEMFVAFYGEDNRSMLTKHLKKHEYTPTVGAKLQYLFSNFTAEQALDKLKEDNVRRTETHGSSRTYQDSVSEPSSGDNGDIDTTVGRLRRI
jgi:chaperone BCS1